MTLFFSSLLFLPIDLLLPSFLPKIGMWNKTVIGVRVTLYRLVPPLRVTRLRSGPEIRQKIGNFKTNNMYSYPTRPTRVKEDLWNCQKHTLVKLLSKTHTGEAWLSYLFAFSCHFCRSLGCRSLDPRVEVAGAKGSYVVDWVKPGCSSLFRAVWQPDDHVLEHVLWRVIMFKFWMCEKNHLLFIMKRQSES